MRSLRTGWPVWLFEIGWSLRPLPAAGPLRAIGTYRLLRSLRAGGLLGFFGTGRPLGALSAGWAAGPLTLGALRPLRACRPCRTVGAR